jgi:hypothetical protein
MATVAPTATGIVELVDSLEQETRKAAAAIVGGTFVQQDSNGNWIQALADTAGHLKGARLALRTVAIGESLTALKCGVVSGFTISQAFNADLFVSDTGTLADAAGTAGGAIARVVAGNANSVDAAHDKNIRIDMPI